MWPLIIGAGAALLLKELFANDKADDARKKVFISFAIEDEKYRNYLVRQAKLDRSPFEFIDMSVKEPYKTEWRKKCRTKIKRCDGMIVLISKNTWHSSGARWEIKCGKEEGIRVIGMHIQKTNKGAVPPELKGKRIIEWTWDNIEESINKM
jgi:hypothetical protein